jgi:hypothetical protein
MPAGDGWVLGAHGHVSRLKAIYFGGLYIGKSPPPWERKILADVIWRKKCEKGKRNGGNVIEKGRKEERGERKRENGK